jgi:hypothetical protein
VIERGCNIQASLSEAGELVVHASLLTGEKPASAMEVGPEHEVLPNPVNGLTNVTDYETLSPVELPSIEDILWAGYEDLRNVPTPDFHPVNSPLFPWEDTVQAFIDLCSTPPYNPTTPTYHHSGMVTLD